MAALLTGAGILVGTAAAASLLLALPAAVLAETAGERNAAGRARVWLAALAVPPALGLAAALWALALHAQGTVASPHLGGLRPHLCLLPLLNAPSGAFVLHSLAWLSLLLVVAAVLRAVAGAISSHLLRRMMVRSGAPLERDDGGVLVIDVGRPASFTAGLLRPVAVVSTMVREELGGDSLMAIVAHERAHMRRRDNLLRLIAEACFALLVFVPTAWYYRRRLRAALEEAADDEAIAAGVPPESLARALKLAEESAELRPRVPSLASLLIPEPAIPAHRRARIADLYDRGAARRAARNLRTTVLAVIGLLLLVVLALVARRAVEDSLYCAAEQLLTAVS